MTITLEPRIALRREGSSELNEVGRGPVGLLGLSVALMPLLRPTLPGNSAIVDVVMFASIIVALAWAAATRVKLRMPYAFPVALAVVAGVIGALAGRFPGPSGLALGQDIFLLVWAAAFVNVCRTPEALRTFLGWWSITSIGWALLLLGAVFSGHAGLAGEAANNGGRTGLTFGDPNLAASYFVPSLAIIWAARIPRSRLLRIAASAALLGALVYTGSNGGLIALVVVAILSQLLRLGRRRNPMVALAVGSILALFVVGGLLFLTPQSVASKAHHGSHLLIDSLGRATESVGSRTTLLHETFSLFRNGDLLGIGPGATVLQLAANQAPYVKEAHNDYTASIVERGVLGGLALLLLIGNVAARCARLLSGRLRSGWQSVVPHPEFLVAAALGFAVSGFFYEVLHFRHLWALLAVIAAIDLWGRPDRAVGEAP